MCDRLPNWLYFCFLLAGIEGRLSAVSTMRKTGECTINREQLDEICPSAPVGGLRIAQLCLRKSSDEVGRKKSHSGSMPAAGCGARRCKALLSSRTRVDNAREHAESPQKKSAWRWWTQVGKCVSARYPVRNRSDEIGPQVAEEVSAKNSCSASCVAVR